MSEHRYTARALAGDYLRAGGGLVFAVAAAAGLGFEPGVAVWLLLGLAALCAVLAVRTALRHATVIDADDQALVRRYPRLPLPSARIAWDRLGQMRLRFFPTNRERSEGWMQLVLVGDGARVTIDSTIDGFGDLARRAAETARRRGLPLSAATQENLAAMGVRTPLDAGREG